MSKRQQRAKAKQRRHAERAKPKNPQRQELKSGEARVTVVESKDGLYSRVTVEYQTHSRATDNGSVGRAIAAEMEGAARMVDNRVAAMQRPGDVVEGEILTPDGRLVLQRWLPVEGELLILQARPATAEDLATLDRYAEDPAETEPRKAEARRVIAELAARAEQEAAPSILEQAAQA